MRAPGFEAVGTSIIPPPVHAGKPVACEDLANLTNFPVPNTQITSVVKSRDLDVTRALSG